MNERRSTFLELSRVARLLLASAEVDESWARPSALREMSVGSLAGHLARCTLSVERYLDAGEPSAEVISAGAYYVQAVPDEDLFSEVNVGVRESGEKEAAGGRAELVQRLDDSIGRLESRLATEPVGRRVAVFKGLVLDLDDYLCTRIVELVVHIDDLAVSVGVATPDLPESAYEIATATMLEVATERHGPLAVVRAMARRERDDANALRVF